MLHQHEIDLGRVKTVLTDLRNGNKDILEAWHSVREVNSINENIAFPDIYKNLKNF